MWPFKKNRYKKLKRDEVVDAIVELENRESNLEQQIIDKAKEADVLFERGKKEKNNDIRLLYAKKIEALKVERKNLVQRSLYLLYNLQLLKKLKDALDDKEFIQASSDVSLQELLADQKNLAKFLNSALHTKVKSEEIMTSADDIFNEVQESYSPDEKIYGISSNDDSLLAIFEEGDSIDNGVKSEEQADVNL